MPRAYDVMMRAVATCTPDTPIAEVAEKMRNLNIGSVLITDKGKLVGIVTDRDLVVHALADGVEAREEPVKSYMSKRVITGQPDWSLDRVAETMSKHQIRRLPIVKEGMLVGIISLGDVALHAKHKDTVAETLRHVSDSKLQRLRRVTPFARVMAIATPLMTTAFVFFITTTKPGKKLREQVKLGTVSAVALAAVGAMRERWQADETQSTIDSLSKQLRRTWETNAPKTMRRSRKTFESVAKQTLKTWNANVPKQFRSARLAKNFRLGG